MIRLFAFLLLLLALSQPPLDPGKKNSETLKVMDVIAHVDSLPSSILEPGGCLPIDGMGMERLLSSLPSTSTVKRSPGGSASNVARGVAELLRRLSGASSSGASPSEEKQIQVQFIGMAGRDETAREYESALAATGVAPRLLRAGSGGEREGEEEVDDGGEEEGKASSLPTATCLCLVSRDGQRTMRTCLGAAALLREEKQLPRGWSEGAVAVHVEGYALWREGLAAGATGVARCEGQRRQRLRQRRQERKSVEEDESSSTPPPPPAAVVTSIDCASFEVVRARRRELEALLGTGAVDILFCNEEEAAALADGGAGGGEGGGGGASEGGGGGGKSDDNVSTVSRALRRALDLGARVAVASLGPAGARAMVKKKRKEKERSGKEEEEEAGNGEGGKSSDFTYLSYSCPAETVDAVVDTVGAGDAFAAGFLSALLLRRMKSKKGGEGAEETEEEDEEDEEDELFGRDAIEAALRLGCASGAAAVRAAGADPGEEAWDGVAATAREEERELVLA